MDNSPIEICSSCSVVIFSAKTELLEITLLNVGYSKETQTPAAEQDHKELVD